MKRRLVWLLSATLLCSITGCSSGAKKNEAITTEYGEVTLCEYDNLSEEKNIYTVTEEEVQAAIESLCAEYAEYNQVERGAKSGDFIQMNVTAAYGEQLLLDYSEEELEINLGSEEYGSEFDEKLTGVKVGEKKKFSITYDKDYEDSEWAGSTIDFDVTVKGVEEESIPECTEEFITGTLGYQSAEDMEEQVKLQLEAENTYNSDYELREALLQQVIDGSKIESYTDELYTSCEASIEQNYASYASMYGLESAQDIYDLFGITEENIKEEVMELVNRTVILNAICEKEELGVSDEDYENGLIKYAADFGYESTDALLEDYNEESIRSWVLEDKALDLLEAQATITEKEATKTEE